MHRAGKVSRVGTLVDTLLQKRHRLRTLDLRWMLLYGPLAATGGVAQAQTLPTPGQPLGTVTGATELQSVTGDSLQTACKGMGAIGIDNLAPASQNLFLRCRELVQTATDGSNTLDLTNAQLNGSLQQVATEESIALGARAGEITSSQLGGAITRISEIRRGVTGFRVSISNPNSTGSVLAGFASPEGWTTTGGAAGDGDFVGEGKLSGFLNVQYGFGDKKGTEREDGFDFSTWGLSAGLDYRINSQFTVGGIFTYSDLDTDFDNVQGTVVGGGVDSDGWGLSAFGTFNHEMFYVDGLIGLGKVNYDLTRNIFYVPGPDAEGTAAVGPPRAFDAKADTDSDDFVGSLGIGHDANRGALSYGPFARLTYYKIDIDGYRESGTGATEFALAVEDQEVKSLTSSIGGRVSYAISRSFGVVMPYARAEWIHEFDNDARTVVATYIHDPNHTLLAARTNDPDRDYGFLGVGLSAVMPHGYQLFVDYQGLVGYSDLNEHRFVAGLRAEF